MIPDHYVWLAWSSSLLVPWTVLFLLFPRHRRAMLWASVLTAPFGLTEPIFVPEYWNPPSLFDLALRTGFDIESIIFCFGIGGVAAVLYNVFTGRRSAPAPAHARTDPHHRYHRLALAAPWLLFPILYLFPWNPIYPGIVAMFAGGIATIWCRPDLKQATLTGGALFLAYYAIFLTGLEVLAPGYIERVWNLTALSGVVILGFPVEELLFAIGFGMYWGGIYEHFTWHRAVRNRLAAA